MEIVCDRLKGKLSLTLFTWENNWVRWGETVLGMCTSQRESLNLHAVRLVVFILYPFVIYPILI